MRGLVSCTGAQFCPVAVIETKNRAMEVCMWGGYLWGRGARGHR